MVIRAAYQSDRASQWIAERAKINAVVLPFTVGGDDAAKDLFGLFDDTIARLLKGRAMNCSAPSSCRSSLPALVAGPARHRDARAARHAGARARHRLHRPRHRADRRLRRAARRSLGFEAEGIAVQVAALAAALAGALLLTWTERVWPDVQEAVIGVVFVLGATGSVLLLASNVHGSEHLRDLLVGQILWAQPSRLLWAALVYAAMLALWFGCARALGRTGFYVLFALAVTVSVQLVGLYLVFATLIVPPLATRRMSAARLAAAWAIGRGGLRDRPGRLERSATCRAGRSSYGRWWRCRSHGMQSLLRVRPKPPGSRILFVDQGRTIRNTPLRSLETPSFDIVRVLHRAFRQATTEQTPRD